jgi:hypothetical protein
MHAGSTALDFITQIVNNKTTARRSIKSFMNLIVGVCLRQVGEDEVVLSASEQSDKVGWQFLVDF